MSYRKSMKKVFAALREQDPDVTIEETRKGHVRVRPGDKTKPLVHLPGTPSDHRSYLNSVKQLERVGYDLKDFR